jgi:hypothetical protein
VRSHSVPRTQKNALRDPSIPPEGKQKFGITCPDALFVESAPVIPKHEKLCDDISWPRRMHYVTRRSDGIQKHKFSVTYPDALFMETAPGAPEHEK